MYRRQSACWREAPRNRKEVDGENLKEFIGVDYKEQRATSSSLTS